MHKVKKIRVFILKFHRLLVQQLPQSLLMKPRCENWETLIRFEFWFHGRERQRRRRGTSKTHDEQQSKWLTPSYVLTMGKEAPSSLFICPLPQSNNLRNQKSCIISSSFSVFHLLLGTFISAQSLPANELQNCYLQGRFSFFTLRFSWRRHHRDRMSCLAESSPGRTVRAPVTSFLIVFLLLSWTETKEKPSLIVARSALGAQNVTKNFDTGSCVSRYG